MSGVYAFGPFVLDALKRRLWREGQLVSITAKTFEVLLVLVEHRDRVVSKDELLTWVWPDTAVQENNLVRQISSLRRALGQRPDEHDYIVTIPGHGYRFVATVETVAEEPGEAEVVTREQPAPEVEIPAAALPAIEPTRSLTFRQVVLAIGGLFLVIAVAIVAIRYASPRREPRRSLQRITYDDVSLPRDAAWAPDGQWVVYSSERGGNADLWKQRLGDPDPVRLTSSDNHESQPDWSPDGQSIVFRSERDGGGLYVIPAHGGVERLVSSFGYEPVWSPDGRHILFKRSIVIPDLPTIYVVGLDGQPPRPFRPDVIGRFSRIHVAWHPDGQRISIWGTTGTNDWRFLTVPLEAGPGSAAEISMQVERELRMVSPGQFVWAPSRRYIYFEGRAGDTQNIWRIVLDPATERWIDGPERVTTSASEETSVAMSRDGTRLLFTATTTRTRLWAFPFDSTNGRVTGQPNPITHGSAGEVDFDARPDGSKVAYRTVRAGRNELWERSIAEGEDRLLLSSPDWRLVKPRWSPDGAQLAFSRCATRDTPLAVAVLNTDGGNERLLTRPSDVDMQAFDWSKDGRAIVGACRFRQSDRYSTCLVPVSDTSHAGGASVRVIASDPKRNLFNQRFSPDQRWISFLAHDLLYSSTSTVYVMPAGGGPWRAITDGASFDDKPRWGPDGSVLYFVSTRSGTANVWGRRFDRSTGTAIGDPFAVTSFQSAQFQLTPRTVQMDIAITPAHLLLPMSEARSGIWMLDQVDW